MTNVIDGYLETIAANGPCSAVTVQAIENHFGCVLPSHYQSFISGHDGGEGFIGDQYLILWRAWSTSACTSPMTPEQAERWRAWWKELSPDDQTRADIEKNWSLDSWLYWMETNNRQWIWWDAKALDDCAHFLVAVEVDAWPFPWGSLRWLFKAAGASGLEPEQ